MPGAETGDRQKSPVEMAPPVGWLDTAEWRPPAVDGAGERQSLGIDGAGSAPRNARQTSHTPEKKIESVVKYVHTAKTVSKCKRFILLVIVIVIDLTSCRSMSAVDTAEAAKGTRLSLFG